MSPRLELDSAELQQEVIACLPQVLDATTSGLPFSDQWASLLATLSQITASPIAFVTVEESNTDALQPHVRLESAHGISNPSPSWSTTFEDWHRRTTSSEKFLIIGGTDASGIAATPEVREAILFPLTVDGQAAGRLGLCNREGGYASSFLEVLRPLIAAAACILKTQRLERRCHKAERDQDIISQRFNNVIQSITELVWVGLPGEIEPLYLNSAFDRIWGCPFDTFRGNPQRLLETFHPEDRELFLGTLQLQAQGRSTSLHYRIIRPDGSIRWIWDRAFPVVDAEGRVISVNGLAADVTELKEAERAVQRSEEQLRQAHKMEALGRLAGGIAHDFNNILGVILGNVELAKQDLDAQHPTFESLEEILKASRRGKSLVRQILAFSRQQPPNRKALGLIPLVEDTRKMLRATLSSGMSIRTVYENELLVILADPIQVHQVLLNLCMNAAQAMDHQGEITIHAGKVTLKDNAASNGWQLSEGDYVSLRVSDTGTGIPPSHLDQIFDPFFTTKPEGQGTGLGLSVVHGIMQSHKGAVRVFSEPGQGATFELLFPVAQPEDSERISSSSWMGRGTGQSILLVDDELSVLATTQQILERQGYLVRSFSRPSEALAMIASDDSSLALIITDYRMPGMNGMSFVEQAMRIRPGIPVVLTSGYLSDELQSVASALGVRSVLSKPTTSEEICRSVHRALSSTGS